VTVSAPIADQCGVPIPNVAPTVSITGPASKRPRFTQGDNISITANASDTDGTITKVEFFTGNILVGNRPLTLLTLLPGQTSAWKLLSDCQATDDKGNK